MGIMLGIGLKLAAQKLLSSAFNRGGKEKPEQDLDSYRELDQRFETKELPKEPPNIALAPKEQFKESIGDRGYGLSEESRSLYERLTEDMKSVIDSNYEIAENINKKLDYTNEVAKTANANALNAAQVSATYGKMNQEAIVGLSQRSGSKVGGLLKNLWDGIKKVISAPLKLLLGGIYKAVTSDTTIPTFTGEKGVDGGVDEAMSENEKAQEEASKAVKEAESAKKDAEASMKEIESSDIWEEFSPQMLLSFDEYRRSNSYDASLSGVEGFNAMFNGVDTPLKKLSDEEKALLYNNAKRYRELEVDYSKASQNEKTAKKAESEAKVAGETLSGIRGILTLNSKGILDRLENIVNLDRETTSLTERGLYEKAAEKSREYQNALESFYNDVMAGKVFSDEQLVELKYKNSDGSWNDKLMKNPDTFFRNLMAKLSETAARSTNYSLPSATMDSLQGFEYVIKASKDMANESSELLGALTSGNINVKDSEGNDVNVSSGPFLQDYFYKGLGGYTFENSLTGETISGTGNGNEVTYKDIVNENDDISAFKSSLSELGYSVEDIGSLTQKQYLELADKMDVNNEVIQYLLTRIWLNTRNSSGVTIINASDSEGLSPGD